MQYYGSGQGKASKMGAKFEGKHIADLEIGVTCAAFACVAGEAIF